MAKKKTIFTCGICGKIGADSVPCGWCGQQFGGKRSHMLCNDCFSKGCPVLKGTKVVTTGSDNLEDETNNL